MVDQYYNHEDDVSNTPEVEFENLQAQEHTLSTYVTQTAEQVNRVVEIGEWLEKRQQDADDQAFVREIVTINNQIGTRLAQSALAHQQAGAFAKRMFEYHQRLARDYNDISDKLEQVESDVDELRDEFTESMKEAYEDIFAEMHNNIKQLTGCDDWGLIYRFNDLLVGNNEDPTPEQVDLLSRLLATFEEPATEPEQS
jgi:uncharacterized coiled-coil DUF342 family protein